MDNFYELVGPREGSNHTDMWRLYGEYPTEGHGQQRHIFTSTLLGQMKVALGYESIGRLYWKQQANPSKIWTYKGLSENIKMLSDHNCRIIKFYELDINPEVTTLAILALSETGEGDDYLVKGSSSTMFFCQNEETSTEDIQHLLYAVINEGNDYPFMTTIPKAASKLSMVAIRTYGFADDTHDSFSAYLNDDQAKIAVKILMEHGLIKRVWG
jgi:hypothetical protein